jgi:sterol desaturase/sphingolipid hydroxylase (fatty acid hydroxylase superfamily)
MAWALLVSVLYAAAAEYAAHRWIMHRPLPWRTARYVEHAVEHHGRGRLDINIDLSPATVLVAASPLLAGCLWLGWSWALVVGGLSAGYAALWTALHRAHHDLGNLWLKALPGYSWWRSHHLQHHDNPRTNFGAVFPWTDYCCGTACRRERT